MENIPESQNIALTVRWFSDLAIAAIESTLQQHLKNAGIRDIRPAHFRVFVYLPSEGCRLTDLAERAGNTKQAMNYLVDHLISRGYLERIPDPTDGRAQLIRLSEKGRDLERIARVAAAEVEQEWRTLLGEERLIQLRQVLEALIAHLENNNYPPGVDTLLR